MNDVAVIGFELGLQKVAVAGPVGVLLKQLGSQIGNLMRAGQAGKAKQLMSQAQNIKKTYATDPQSAMRMVQGGAAPAAAKAAPAAAAAAPAAAAAVAPGGEGLIAGLGRFTRKGLGMIDPSLASTGFTDRGLGTLAGGLGLGTGAYYATEPVGPQQYA